MLFITEKRPDLRIYSPRLGRPITFVGGRYETDDPAEIAVLNRNRYVSNFTEDVERPLTEPSPLDNPVGLPVSRDELYEHAKELDIEGRSDMTKAELAEAIKQALAEIREAKDNADRPADQ